MEIRKQCKAITKEGRKCCHSATIDGYCMVHYLHIQKKNGKKNTTKKILS